MASNAPIPIPRLESLTNTACASALSTATSYTHASTADWNNSIVSTLLSSLIKESTSTPSPPSSEDAAGGAAQEGPKYKFAVNSTIIQHLSDPASSGGEGGGEGGKVGRRGMHSASGAYWNNERDGMWSHKYVGGEDKGMDVVVCVMWIGV